MYKHPQQAGRLHKELFNTGNKRTTRYSGGTIGNIDKHQPFDAGIGQTYRRHVIALVVIFLITASLFAAAGWLLARQHLHISSQALNRDLAARIVDENQLIYRTGDMLDTVAIKSTFDRYMSLNPALEIYQLDHQGNIIAYSAEKSVVTRTHVSLEPIHDLLQHRRPLPILGDDPRGVHRQKIFSATRLGDTANQRNTMGYLYVILRGEAVDVIERSTGDSHLTRVLLAALVISLGSGLLISLIVFKWLGRPLESLTAQAITTAQSLKLRLHPASAHHASEVTTLASTFNTMDERIRSQMHELQQRDHQRRRFIADISHDLRTPLAVVNSVLESLQIRFTRMDKSVQLDHIETARQQTTHLSRLVDDLFQLARLENPGTRSANEPINMADLIQDVTHKHKLACENTGIQLFASVTERLPLVQGNTGLMERLFDNLISNAVAHTPTGGTINLHAHNRGRQLIISIVDSGSGIAEADRQKVFESGYRAANANSAGAGLGLNIARRIARLHRGNLTIVPCSHGTHLDLTLPTEY